MAWLLAKPTDNRITLAEIITSFILAILLVCLNSAHGRAFIGQIVLSALYGVWALPCGRLGLSLLMTLDIDRNLLIVLALIFFGIVWFIWFYYYRGQYDLTSQENQEWGRMDVNNGYWDLSNPVFTKKENASTNKFWAGIIRVAIPLGPLIGILFYRRASGSDSLSFIYVISLVVALLLLIFCSMNAAIAVELLKVEKTLEKKIVLHSS